MYLEDGIIYEVNKKIVNHFLKMVYILFKEIKYIYIKEKQNGKLLMIDVL